MTALSLRQRLLLLAVFATLPFYGLFAYYLFKEAGAGWAAVLGNLLLLGLAMSAALVLTIKTSDWLILRGLRKFTASARRMSKGDLSARSGLPHGNDELGHLAHSFDKMADGVVGMTRALRALSGSNQALLRADNEQMLLEQMCAVAVEYCGYRVAWVGYGQNDADKRVQPMAHVGHDGGHLARIKISWADDVPEGQGIVGTAIRTGQPQVDKRMIDNPRFAPWRTALIERNIGAGCALPLVIDGRCIGAITLYAPESDAFDAKELEILNEMAQDLSFGIHTLRQRIEYKKAEETIHYLSHFDSLTGLANQLQMADRLRQLIAEKLQNGRRFALLVIDIERFSEIQDALGYRGRDELLLEAAQRLRAIADREPGHWILGRLMGDRFGVLLPYAGDPAGDQPAVANALSAFPAPRQSAEEQAIRAAKKLLEVFSTPFELAGIMVEAHADVGITLFPDHGDDADALIRRAALAARRGEKSGTDVMVYRGETEYENPQRLALIAELRRAIERNELILHYQPKIDSHTLEITGAEALVRWQHPQRGLIPPLEFISLAEQTGLIKPLTYWVLNESLRQSKAWSDQGFHIKVAINLSARNLRDPQLLDQLNGYFENWGVPHDTLQIEITESVVMEDKEASHETLARLKAMGIKLYIDDFGTGYSSLGYLSTLPVHSLKIDRSFVVGLTQKPEMHTLVSAIITMSHNLGLTVVAEGVEDQERFNILKMLGCDEIQGYFFSRPLAADGFREWCTQRVPVPADSRQLAAIK